MNKPVSTAETRSFQYSDGKSDKFWLITLEDDQHTVRYGRMGTQGQQQTKEFPTAEKARQSYEKLIREKLAKGYVETEGPAQSPPMAESTASSEPPVLVPEPTSEAVSTIAGTPVSEPLIASAARSDTPAKVPLNLYPEDWFWATWRNQPPLHRPAALPFDPKRAQSQLAQVVAEDRMGRWDWSKADIAVSLSREEAQFWWVAVTHPRDQVTPSQLAERLGNLSFIGDLPFENFCQALLDPEPKAAYGTTPYAGIAQQFSRDVNSPLIKLFSNLFPASKFIDLCLFLEAQLVNLPRHETWGLLGLRNHLAQGFRQYVLPYLTEAERGTLRNQVEAHLDPTHWPTDYYVPPAPMFFFAASLGCPTLERVVARWPDDYYQESGWRVDYYHRPQEIIFGLGTPEQVQFQMRRLNLSLQFPDQFNTSASYIRAWLAHTELSALDTIGRTIAGTTNKKDAEALVKEFALCVQVPEVAPTMLELMLSSKAPGLAREWLLEHPSETIAGLLPVTVERGKLAEAAIDFLRVMHRKGHTAILQDCLTTAPPEVAAKIQATVLELEAQTYVSFDPQTTPDWLQQALASLTSKSTKKISWPISASDLPAITVGNACFNDAQIEAVLNALRQSKLETPHPLMGALKTHCDRAVLDVFAWKLFELWLATGAPSKENWAMSAVGLLGADASALKLAPLIRIWPGESQHQRAVLGLECLRTIGTDTALMQINGIAQKVKFKGIKQRAQDCMDAIAQDRQMSRAELEDRIVPDCDLDAQGSCLFDFGSRQFHFVLGSDLKPMVKDGDGKIKPNLPNPGVKDDRDKAQAAVDAWKLLKKQIGEVVKIQTARLEQAMVTGRRWPVPDFELLLVQHPLMTHLTQRLIWGGYDPAGQLTATFRVTEDRTYADSQDETFELTGVDRVGIVHPLHLPMESRSVWGDLLSDYEIVQPFTQLGRSLHSLEASEEKQTEITRFKDAKVPAVALVGTLEKFDWIRGIPQDAGVYYEHSKPFYGANVTAIVQYDGVPVGYMDGWDDQAIERCFFLRGIYTPQMYPDHRDALSLSAVDPVVISEVLKDLSAIAAKAK